MAIESPHRARSKGLEQQVMGGSHNQLLIKHQRTDGT